MTSLLTAAPECDRPRSQQRPHTRGSWKVPTRVARSTLLRPRTGALRAEQQRIVAKVDELMRWCNALEARLTAAQTTAAALLDATLHQILAA